MSPIIPLPPVVPMIWRAASGAWSSEKMPAQVP